MKNTDQPNTATHPQAADLDRLRAGLYDRDNATRDALLQHLQACDTCRARIADWDGLRNAADTARDPRLSRELRTRRQAALAGQASGRATPEQHWPRYAVAATLAITIGIGVFFRFEAPLPGAQPELSVAQSDKVPDVYTDIDFYLWLAKQPAHNDSEENRS